MNEINFKMFFFQYSPVYLQPHIQCLLHVISFISSLIHSTHSTLLYHMFAYEYEIKNISWRV